MKKEKEEKRRGNWHEVGKGEKEVKWEFGRAAKKQMEYIDEGKKM